MSKKQFTTRLAIALVFCCPLLADAQVFRNGDFDNGVEGWGWSQQESARGEFTAVMYFRSGDRPPPDDRLES